MSKRQIDEADKQLPFDKDTKYTVNQVAKEHLHKSTKTVYTLIKERKLKAYRFGKEFVITATQLNDFANERHLKKWFPDLADLSELDPAYKPPTEVALDSLTEKEILAAFVIPFEWFPEITDLDSWMAAAKLAGLDREP